MSKILDEYGSNVFGLEELQKYLPKSSFVEFKNLLKIRQPMNTALANDIAEAMKQWATKRGATHFTHWFQPLSGTTSEKHTAFVQPVDEEHAIFEFSGKELIQSEPDASSFPSGGLRACFEARGYTVWDPTSYAFIKDEVLCIPTCFCSYNGEALDKKTPLLRSMRAVEDQVKRFCKFFGMDVDKVEINVGLEQEFFLIPEKDYERREDLVLCGRTLFGHSPCKGQELEEHYFGAIRPSVNKFFKELDDELWKLGIPAKFKHNEVAPAQHEIVPLFNNVNIAIDQNLLLMEKMRLIASKHGFVCLLHEKPFNGINGSGKHNNWSISVDGENLFQQSDDFIKNLRFMIMVTCFIKAVEQYQDLLRTASASTGNDHRLGGMEAPPAILSMYLGNDLEEKIEKFISGDSLTNDCLPKDIDLGAGSVPVLDKDGSDRNRTSPMAFTGNKFEFRMPGSNANVSDENTVLNTAFARCLEEFNDNFNSCLNGKTKNIFEDSNNFKKATQLIKFYYENHKHIIFNGDGYTDEWLAAAKDRGLANFKTTAEALPCIVSSKSIDLFESQNVLSREELQSRYEVELGKYNKLINIEIRLMKRMVRRTFLPAINEYMIELAEGVNKISSAMGVSVSELNQQEVLNRLQKAYNNAFVLQESLDLLHRESFDMENQQERANFNTHTIFPLMKKLRDEIDRAETFTYRNFWPCPSYNNMLFYV